MKEGSCRFGVGIVLLSAAVLLAGCVVTDNGAPGSSFTLVSGSGTLTVRLLNGSGVGPTFMFGTTSTGTAIGGGVAITGNDVSGTLDSGGSVVFTGGTPFVVSGFIDVDNDAGTTHMPDDGDYLALRTVTISGNTTVTFTYPGDFTLVSGSGTLTARLLNASPHNTKMFYFGTTSTGEPIGGGFTISGDDTSQTLQYGGGGDVVFPGGYPIAFGGFIDVNGTGAAKHMPDDGDYLVSKTVTLVGNATVTFIYPDDFTLVSGSGKIVINLLNANTAHGGEAFAFGTISMGTPLGSSAIINSNSMLLTLQNSGVDVVFPGGYQIAAGGFIDVDDDGDTWHMADDGDYVASQTVTVAGDTVVVFTY